MKWFLGNRMAMVIVVVLVVAGIAGVVRDIFFPTWSVQEMAGVDQYTRADMCLRLRDVTLKLWDDEVQAMCRVELADYMRERRATWDADWQAAFTP